MNALETTVRKLKNGLGLSSQSALVRGVRPAYDALLRTAFGKRGLARAMHGEEPLYLRPECRAYDEAAEPEVFATLKRLAQSGGVILDVGASVGVYSMLLARWAGASGRVYAFEPSPRTFALLREHLALNSLQRRVEAVRQAVSDQCGEAVFYAHEISGESSLNVGFAQRVSGAEAVRVPVTTIDNFCGDNNIAPRLIKIDVEGYDLHALRGARETLLRHRPQLVVELHPMHFAEVGVSVGELEEFLHSIPYRVTSLEGYSEPLTKIGHIWLEPAQ
jgi:FkbM family methyltransferase